MKTFSLHVPKGTTVRDEFGSWVEEYGVTLHVVADTIQKAHAYIETVYATHIGEDRVAAFNTMPSKPVAEAFAAVLGRAVKVSGSINIEGGLLREMENVTAHVRATENGKTRWIQVSSRLEYFSRHNIIDELHKIF